MKNNFRGWTSVFSFTFRQATKGVSFKLVTVLVSLAIIAIITVINIIAAKPDADGKVEPSPIGSVFVLDNSGLQLTEFKQQSPQLSSEQFQHIMFVNFTGETREDIIQKAAADSNQTIVVIISKNDTGYDMEAVVPPNSTITKQQAESVIGPMTQGFEANKLLQSGLTADQLMVALKPATISTTDIGENTNQIVFIINMIAPMLFGLMLYVMLMLYGQEVSKSVSTEKTSKLMETILTSIHPYALITGKVLAVTSMALLQFSAWIVSAIVGLYGGSAIASAIYPQYQNSVVSFINFIKDNIGETAMSVPAVIMALLIFCIGFLFYSVLASLAGCMVSKPEDTATSQAIFQFPVIISWLICYLAPVMGNEGILKVARYVPLTTPFCVPVDLITGNISLLEGGISMAVLLVFTLLVIMLAGRLHLGLILYTGQKPSLKVIGNMLRNNK